MKHITELNQEKVVMTVEEFLALNARKPKKKPEMVKRTERPQKTITDWCPFCMRICNIEEHVTIIRKLNTSNLK